MHPPAISVPGRKWLTSPFVPPSGSVLPVNRLGLAHMDLQLPHLLEMATGDLTGDESSLATFSMPEVATARSAGTLMSVEHASAVIPRPSAPNAFRTNDFSPLTEGIVSPVNVDLLEHLLEAHPDRSLVSFVVSGFRVGFDIGFVGEFRYSNPPNLLSARNNPRPVTAAILKEVQRRHASGPFLHPPFLTLHCSPLGAVPKKDGSTRIILDLSSPRGNAINEGIPKEAFTVRYSSFDDAVDLIRSLGKGSYMAKMDIKHAFRLCPVRQDQWCLLGYQWMDRFYVDTRLPFGSRSSPFIFNSFADCLLWIFMVIGGVNFALHYLDDFFLCGSTEQQVQSDMNTVVSLCSELGVPLADDKTVGPSLSLTYLGIEIDSSAMQIRLPQDKLDDLLSRLHDWDQRKKCTKRELLSLIGSLSFAAKVVKPGRMFLRRLIDLSTSVDRLHHHISLNSSGRADIRWWLEFLPSWNGKCFIQSDLISSPSISLFTDASGLGLGSVYGKEWFSAPWPSAYSCFHINVLELFAIVAAVFTWGHSWENQQILFFTDNLSITQVWLTGSSRDPNIMTLVRSLFLFTARKNINIVMQHVPGYSNGKADALSRLQVPRFRKLHRHAALEPTLIHPDVWNILIVQ